MKVQIILSNEIEPIKFNKAKIIEISNMSGLQITGLSYHKIFPLEKIKSIMVVSNESSSN